jgi:DUF177 domain-containing protein
MLSFDVHSLATKAAQVDGNLAADDPTWQDGDPRPTTTVHVKGRLSSAGAGRYYLSGRIHGEVAGECRRCLTEVVAPVDEEVHLIFVEADDAEVDDPDVYLLDPRANELDIRPAIREQWLLGVPHFVQCREDCKGLCPTCGADLNAGTCSCAPATDNRWDALRTARSDRS